MNDKSILCLLVDPELFEKSKYKDKLLMKCSQCNIPKARFKRHICHALRDGQNTYFCSQRCSALFNGESFKIPCKICGKLVLRNKSHLSKNTFCGSSCAASHNRNFSKRKIMSRSKLEIWLESQLLVLYPDLEFYFNRRDIIGSELDIYLPKFKLAFELNGIFHYEPIHGQLTLEKTQNNDNRKFQACLENGIELCIIDSSKMINSIPKKSQPYLDIIKNIIDNKLNNFDLGLTN